MKKNLEIQDFEDKKTKAGKRYTRFKTSDGWMSCFDNDTITQLKDYEGKTASVEIQTSGDFSNIKKVYGVASGPAGSEEVDLDADEVEVEKVSSVSSGNKGTSYYTSYAKDIFCSIFVPHTDDQGAGIDEKDAKNDMNLSIELVKQAKAAFE